VGQDRPLGSSIARKLHNAVLVGFMWCNLPPVRCCSLRWLQIPGSKACLKPDCKLVGCLGNRLYWKEEALCLLFSHYKVENRYFLLPRIAGAPCARVPCACCKRTKCNLQKY